MKVFVTIDMRKKMFVKNVWKKGYISCVLFLRRCDYCFDKGFICRRMDVFVLFIDCELFNKIVFEIIKFKIENGEIDLYLSLFLILFDCFYVGKSLKVLFLNWWLK